MSICELEQQGDVAILTPGANLGEDVRKDYEAVSDATVEMLENGHVKHVVVDFDRTDYFGWHVITWLLNLGERLRSLGGKIALARLSAQEKEILDMVKLGTLWPVHSSREEAIEAAKE